MRRTQLMNVMTVLVALIAAGTVIAIGRGALWALALGTVVAVLLCCVRALLSRRRLREELQPFGAAASAQAELLTSQPRPDFAPDAAEPFTLSLALDEDPLEAQQRRSAQASSDEDRSA